MNDTRTKLETLFRRLTDPALSDLEAFCWFRKEVRAHSSEDVAQALGAQGAPAYTAQAAPATFAHANEPMRFGKYGPRRVGGALTWGQVVRENRSYLEYLLVAPPDPKYKPMPEETKRMIREALGQVPPSVPNRNADYLRQEGPTT